MSWDIVYTAQARQDLRDIYEYIALDNYLIFYLPEEPQNTVSIVGIMYGGRDVRRQLSETVL